MVSKFQSQKPNINIENGSRINVLQCVHGKWHDVKYVYIYMTDNDILALLRATNQKGKLSVSFLKAVFKEENVEQ